MTEALLITRKSLETMHVVYSHMVDGKVIFIGLCKLVDLYRLPDARTNTLWETMTRGNAYIIMNTLFTGESYEACDRFRFSWMQTNGMPVCNAKGLVLKKKRPEIICNETSVLYKTQSAAAKELGLHTSALSNHLRGLPGFKTVGGFTFRYTVETD